MIHGWLVLDKPLGRTSMQATARVKRLLLTKKAGHAGTLDPLASGILPIALGEATKTIHFMVDATKTYEFTVRWGMQTTTDDKEGEVLSTSGVRPTQEKIIQVLQLFRGKINQVPPRYSAIKIGGKRAYSLARAGQEVEIPLRTVDIQKLQLIDIPDEDHATFHCECSKGTYIRSLGRDIALKLGTCGHVSKLRRTRVGCFTEKNAISLDFLENMSHKGPLEDSVLPVDAVLDDIPDCVLNEEEARRFCHGQRLLKDNLNEGETLVLRKSDDALLGIGQVIEGKIKPVRMLNIHERSE